jgi:acid phosphatase (class A)
MRKQTGFTIGFLAVSIATCGVLAQAPLAMRPMLGQGYLTAEAAPDGLALVPPPPAPGSPEAAGDARGEAAALALRGTLRWELARQDADLRSPAATGAFSCAAGRVISPDTTPRTDALLRRTLSDFARASAAAKQHYGRKRPFEGNGQPICTPEEEGALRGNASYPSGHATIGYGWALVLADLLPQRRAELLARGEDFGDSRRICNVHFASDVAAGRALALPVLKRLLADRVFQADLAAARAELQALAPAAPDCAHEAAARTLAPKDP